MAITKGRSSKGSETKTLKVGDRAPDLELKSHSGEMFRLSDLRGKQNVVLAFYPFAFSPTCASQMPSHEANLDRFKGHNAQVVGISIDSTHANRAWAQVLGGITYPLLSDFYPHGRVAEQYGVLRPEGMAERAIFIIDKAGVVRYIDVHEIAEQPDEEQIFDELRKLD
jgi:mycoredoxin-dependent peroxiredoxin